MMLERLPFSLRFYLALFSWKDFMRWLVGFSLTGGLIAVCFGSLMGFPVMLLSLVIIEFLDGPKKGEMPPYRQQPPISRQI